MVKENINSGGSSSRGGCEKANPVTPITTATLFFAMFFWL
jgi:hypothetical protein